MQHIPHARLSTLVTMFLCLLGVAAGVMRLRSARPPDKTPSAAEIKCPVLKVVETWDGPMASVYLEIAGPEEPPHVIRYRGRIGVTGEVTDLHSRGTHGLWEAYAAKAIGCCYRPGGDLRRLHAQVEVIVRFADAPTTCDSKPVFDEALRSIRRGD